MPLRNASGRLGQHCNGTLVTKSLFLANMPWLLKRVGHIYQTCNMSILQDWNKASTQHHSQTECESTAIETPT